MTDPAISQASAAPAPVQTGTDAKGNPLFAPVPAVEVAAAAPVALPVVTKIVPATGPVDTVVVVSGTGFSGATAVKFGGAAAKSFSVNSDTEITATAPAGNASADVTVVTPGGASAVNTADKFLFVAPPTVSAITPAEGPTAGGVVVAITGANLTGATAVKFGGNPAASFTVNNDTSITATAPPGADTVDVVVTTPAGATAPGTKFKYIGLPVLVAKCTAKTPVGNDGAVIPKTGTVLITCPAGYGVESFGYLSAVLPAGAQIDDVVEVHAIASLEHSGILVSLFPPIGESIGSRPASTGANSDAASAVTSDSGRLFRKVSATNWRGLGGGSN